MMSALDLYGTLEPPASSQILTAGALSVELEGGNLRYARWRGVEIIRAISFLVRGPTWATYDAVLDDVQIEQTAAAFRIRYRATVRDGASELAYVADISGQGGALRFTCAIHAATEFRTCRTGFVVLHPASVAGQPVGIEHADGRRIEGTFPALIDPVQPMLDLRALTHHPAPGLSVTCRMEGDVFEMEDQRNWTDASFKTYVRPLSRPWPYTLPAGSVSTQTVSLAVATDAAATAPTAADAVAVTVGAPVATMPMLGLGCTAAEARAALPHAARLAAAGVATLVCRLDPAPGEAASDLRAFRALADFGYDIELQIVVRSIEDFAAELRRTAAALGEAGLRPRTVAVSPASDLKSTTPGQPWPPSPELEKLIQAARAAFPGVRLGGGMFSYFTELNRRRPPVALLDFVTFSTSPLVHSADDRSVMESLQALPAVVASVRAIAGGRPFVVGPSAIGLRDNPYGAAPLENPDRRRLPMSGEDPRQAAQFNAAWTLGYIAQFAVGGAERVALSAPVGAFGIFDEQAVFPVFAVIEGCSALRGATLHALQGLDDGLAGLLAVRDDRRELWLANLTPERRAVGLPETFRHATLHGIGQDVAATASPAVALEPYAVLRCVG